jgi:hypothetical protein
MAAWGARGAGDTSRTGHWSSSPSAAALSQCSRPASVRRGCIIGLPACSRSLASPFCPSPCPWFSRGAFAGTGTTLATRRDETYSSECHATTACGCTPSNLCVCVLLIPRLQG